MTKAAFPLLLAETAAIWRNLLDKRLKPLGLSQAKWRALLHISLAGKPLTQIELAQRLGIEGASLVSLLDGLAKNDWIVREAVTHDRRSKAIKLTSKALATLEHIHAAANQLREELLADITEDAVEQCNQLFEQLKKRAKEIV